MIPRPIPEDARPGDPRYALAFLSLAEGLVRAGAKAKIIERFTSLRHRQVTDMYKALRGTDPPAGPVMQGSAHYFAMPGRKTSEAVRIQCIIFLGCYGSLSRITATPPHRGWLLLTAFNSYQSITTKLHEVTSIRKFDINQAYALLTFCSFLALPNSAELQLRQCTNCSITYPVVAIEPLDNQPCPVCTISAHYYRLAHKTASTNIENSAYPMV